MDEKEFLNYNSSNALVEEQNNLDKNIIKIENVINFYEKYRKKFKEDCDTYRGEPSYYNDFLSSKREYNKYDLKVRNLEENLDNPYHMHVYIKDKSEEEDLYIGLNDVYDQNGKRIVYSIWSKVASVLSKNNVNSFTVNGYKYDLVFKRNISIEKKKIIDFTEVYNINSGVDEDVTDYYLRNILRSKKNVRGFSDIVKTIQKNQDMIIRADINSNIICQGVAGSGKTAIIVHRLSNLLYNNREVPAERFLFIAPNDNFKKELSDLNKKLHIDKVNLLTLYEYYKIKINRFLNYIYGFDKSKKERSNIKNYINHIIDDKNLDIEQLYSQDYLDSKLDIVLDYLYVRLFPIMKYYNLDYEKDNFYKKISTLKTLIVNKMASYNEIKGKINLAFTSIIDLSKRLGQSADSEDKISDYDDILKNYNAITYNSISIYNDKIKKVEKEIENNKILINYDFYNQYSFSEEKLEAEINRLSFEFESLNDNIVEMEKSLLSVIRRNAINDYKVKLEELDNTINSLKEKLNRLKSEEYNEIYNIYLANEEKLSRFKNALNCLYLTKELEIYIIPSIEVYEKISTVYSDVISYKRILKNLLKYIDINCEMIIPDRIAQIIKMLISSVNLGSKLDIESHNKDVLNLSALNDSISEKNIVSLCLNGVLNNKYDDRISKLNNRLFERNDIVILLYIFTKLGFYDDKLYDYLFIDEAQDYNDIEIKLLSQLEYNPRMNIFGDYNQNISKNAIPRSNWNSLIKMINNDSKYFELNENYRNTTNVVEYCNKIFKSNIKKIGIDGNDVKVIKETDLNELIKLYYSNNNIIITNDLDLINKLKSIDSDIKCNTVLDVKGLEFDNIIVVDTNMDNNSKYVAYTRTKNDLVIINKIDGSSKINVDINKIKREVAIVEEKRDFKVKKEETKRLDTIENKTKNKDVINNKTISYDLEDNKLIKLLTLVDKGKANASSLIPYQYNKNMDPILKSKIKHRLIANGLLKYDVYKNMIQTEMKIILIEDLLKDISNIRQSQFVNVLKYYSNNDSERDYLYDIIIDKGYVIDED